MNFQLACIVWGAGLVVTWVIFTYFTSPDMLVLGLYPVDTPQQLCSVTLRGKEIQKRLMPTKAMYMVLMYIFTTGFNFAYALYQRKRFLSMDDETSMTDFAAICVGLPEMEGSELVENKIKESIETATGAKVVGVSVCWACKELEEDIADAIDKEVQMSEESPTLPDQATLDENNDGAVNKVFGFVDSVFGFTGRVPEEVSESEEEKSVDDMIKGISSTDAAFIVFETEESRDKAVAFVKSKEGISFEGNVINLMKESCEPDTVKWSNFKVTNGEFFTKLAIGIVVIIVALLVWCFGFYLPFAYYQASFAKQGEEPPFTAAFLFSMLVVGGNQIMYSRSREGYEHICSHGHGPIWRPSTQPDAVRSDRVFSTWNFSQDDARTRGFTRCCVCLRSVSHPALCTDFRLCQRSH
jgi:hypothetical protein